jgi:hypothetical protein
MHIAAELTVFLGLHLQGEHIFSLVLSTARRFGETECYL